MCSCSKGNSVGVRRRVTSKELLIRGEHHSVTSLFNIFIKNSSSHLRWASRASIYGDPSPIRILDGASLTDLSSISFLTRQSRRIQIRSCCFLWRSGIRLRLGFFPEKPDLNLPVSGNILDFTTGSTCPSNCHGNCPRRLAESEMYRVKV